MSIRKKTLLVIGSTLICLVLIEFLSARSFLLANFNQLEERLARVNVERVINILADDQENLDAIVNDWAAWDDTYAFIQNQNPEYVRSNLVEDTFLGLHLNLIVFVQSSGLIVYQRAYELINEVEIPPPQSLSQHLVPDSFLLSHSNPSSKVSGILMLPEGPMLLSSQPILTSEGEGPVRGTLIMGRFLDAGKIKKLSERTFLAVYLVQAEYPNLPKEFGEIDSDNEKKSPVLIQISDKQSIVGYSLLRDVYGKPALVLKVEMPREISSQGQASNLFYLGALLTFGLILGAITFWLLDQLVLKRVALLSKDIKLVGSICDHSGRVSVDGEDEISQLSLEINLMLQALQDSERNLQQSEIRYRSIVENQYDLVCQWLPDGIITFVNEAYCRYFSSRKGEVIGQSFLKYIHPEDTDRVINHIASFCKENGEGLIEYRINTPAGKLRWQQWIDHMIYDQTSHSYEILSVGRDITEKRNSEQELKQRLDFERLITTLSASFINISVEEVASQIDHTLKAIGEFAEVDRSYVFQLAGGGISMENTHEWCAEGIEPQIDQLQGLPISDFPWLVERLKRFETIPIPSVAELPPEAVAEKSIFEALGILSLIVVPIIYGGSLQGFLGFDSIRNAKAWENESITLLKLVSDILANAIAHHRFQNELLSRERNLNKLNEITVLAINSNDLGEMLDFLAARMSELIQADGCYLTLWDEQSKSTTLAAASQPYAQQYKDLKIEPGETTLTGYVLEAGHEIVVEDVSNSSYIIPRITRLFPICSLLCAPLIADNQKLGAVLLAFDQPHHFTSSEIALCNQAANQIALAVLKMTLLHKSEQRAQEAETLRLSGAAIAATLEPEEAIERILDQLERVVPYDSASVQLLQEGYLEIRAGRGWPEPEHVVGLRFPIPGDNPNTVVITQQKPLLLDDDLETYSTFRDEPHAHIRSWLGVPLIVRDRIIGLLAVDKWEPHFYKSNHIDLLAAFADQVSISLENSRLYADEHRRAKELDALRATVVDITGELDIPCLLHTIVERAITLLGGTGGGLYLCDHEKQELTCVTSMNTPSDFTGVVLKLGEGAAGIVAQTGKPLIIGDYRVWEGRAQVYETDQPFRSVLSAPLVWRDKVLGVIHILHATEPHRFNQGDSTLLTLFADQAAIALDNAQLYTDSQHRGQRIALLNEIIQVAISAPGLDEMLRSLVDRIGQLFEADGVYITLWDEEHETVTPAAAYGTLSEVYTTIQPIKGDPTITSASLKSGSVLAVEDVHHSEYISPRVAAIFPSRSILGLPLIADGHKLGAALISYNQPRVFSHKDITLGEEVSAQIALAMSKMRLLEVERRRADELDSLRAVVTDISSELELETLLCKILERSVMLLNATGGDLGLYEDERSEICIVVSHNMGKDYLETRMKIGEGAMGRAIETRLPVIISDYQQWEGRSPQYLDTPYHAVMAVPLQVRGQMIGAIGVVDNNPKREFSFEDQRLFYLFAQQAAIALENAQLFKEIERQSITDLLTGIYNRRGLLEFGERELDRSSRFGRAFSVILFDIDNFKKINDHFGHLIGDTILLGVAKLVQSVLREIDILGRYGGEEFVVLLPEADEQSAYLVAERLREAVLKTPFETERGLIPITISLGVTCISDVKQELGSLIDQADTAMYQAKRTGRNRACIFEKV